MLIPQHFTERLIITFKPSCLLLADLKEEHFQFRWWHALLRFCQKIPLMVIAGFDTFGYGWLSKQTTNLKCSFSENRHLDEMPFDLTTVSYPLTNLKEITPLSMFIEITWSLYSHRISSLSQNQLLKMMRRSTTPKLANNYWPFFSSASRQSATALRADRRDISPVQFLWATIQRKHECKEIS